MDINQFAQAASPYIGGAAAFLTTVSFLPQVIKTLQTRDTAGISLLMYSLFVTGILGWTIYGIIKGDFPLILANSVTFVLAGIVLGLKIFQTFK